MIWPMPVIFFMKKKTSHFLINIGTGKEQTIKYYAELISKLISGNNKMKIRL